MSGPVNPRSLLLPRPQQRRKNKYRGPIIALALVLVIMIIFGYVILPPKSHLATVAISTSTTTTTTTTVPPSTTTTSTLPVTTTTSPAGLAQTATKPSSSSADLTHRFSHLFDAIVADAPGAAVSLFFPESVYIEMKSGILSNPAEDFSSRLIAFFQLDVVAYHNALVAPASSAQLVAINANPALAQWIPVGACENHFGYWHLPNVRIVYRDHGVRSFAIASLISWRGEWYVVHLGPNPRPSNVGTVALPARGPGTPGPGGGC